VNIAAAFAWGAVGFAFLAALLWWGASAAAAMPRRTVPGLGNNGGAVQQAIERARRQSRWGTAAAAMAGCAAMLQAISLTVAQLL
jgi:hypothetical protein